jgi:hypothetical protein
MQRFYIILRSYAEDDGPGQDVGWAGQEEQ